MTLLLIIFGLVILYFAIRFIVVLYAFAKASEEFRKEERERSEAYRSAARGAAERRAEDEAEFEANQQRTNHG